MVTPSSFLLVNHTLSTVQMTLKTYSHLKSTMIITAVGILTCVGWGCGGEGVGCEDEGVGCGDEGVGCGDEGVGCGVG